ncbi:hypothetical protein CCH79_00012635 [Gambusia affinis]|uniref:Uncharacterized protein n=1 Tax=Gambusia affinis TaxID=33528 RepID=A0A315VHB8_GAMAF|nr:hypothetical protein CCH79_00012635 [Gambusia affinis]
MILGSGYDAPWETESPGAPSATVSSCPYALQTLSAVQNLGQCSLSLRRLRGSRADHRDIIRTNSEKTREMNANMDAEMVASKFSLTLKVHLAVSVELLHGFTQLRQTDLTVTVGVKLRQDDKFAPLTDLLAQFDELHLDLICFIAYSSQLENNTLACARF